MHAVAATRPSQRTPTLWWSALPLAAAPAVVIVAIPAAAPAWVRMWALAVSIYAGCKWLTWREAGVAASWWRTVAYLVAWPGMDARRFLAGRVEPSDRPDLREWLASAFKLALGVAFIVGTRGIPAGEELVRGWAGMVGIALVLHFGLFQLLSDVWRTLGVPAEPIMNRPAMSCSVSEFWGRRWNMAFRDLAHRFLFRPLTARIGPLKALWVGFLASGLVHDFVISFPVGAGYGLPTLYFLIQPTAILLERSRVGKKLGLGRGFRGWLFTATVLLIPAPLLFHAPFIRGVVLPFVGFLTGN